jgi:hypothetical protein
MDAKVTLLTININILAKYVIVGQIFIKKNAAK